MALLGTIRAGMSVYLFSLTMLFLLCHSDKKSAQLKMYEKIPAMKQEIQKHIPIGTAVDDAKRIMEANGFKCQLMEQSDAVEMEDDRPPIRSSHNIDFLYCDKEKKGLICARRWQVALVHKNGFVSDVLVSIAQTCL